MGCVNQPVSDPPNDDPPKEDIKSTYEFRQTLAKERYCRVVAGIHLTTQTKVAIKIMHKSATRSTFFIHEVTMLKHLNHKNIIKLIDYSEDETNYYIITKLCHGGELLDRITNKEFNINEEMCSNIIRQLLMALKYLHKRNIVHRNLKPG